MDELAMASPRQAVWICCRLSDRRVLAVMVAAAFVLEIVVNGAWEDKQYLFVRPKRENWHVLWPRLGPGG